MVIIMKRVKPAPGDQSLTSSSIDLLNSFFSVALDPYSDYGGSLQGVLTDTIKNSISFIGARTIKIMMLRAAISQPPLLFNRLLDKFYGLFRVQSDNDSLNIDYSEQEILGLIKSLKKINDFYYNREAMVEHGLVTTYQMLRLTAWNTVERTSDTSPSDAASGTNISNNPDILMPLVRAYLDDKVNQLIGMMFINLNPKVKAEAEAGAVASIHAVLNGLPSYTAWREKDETLSHDERHYHHLTEQMPNMALIFAAFDGHVDEVTALLTTGADVNHGDQHGKTALMWAAFNGHLAVVYRLLELDDIDVNAADRFGFTALMMATKNGHVNVVEVLLNRGADVNHADEHRETALIWAAENGNVHVVEALLERGADVNLADQDGKTAFMRAARNGNVDVVNTLLAADGINVNATDSHGRTAFMYAAMSGRVELVEALLKAGVDVNLCDRNGMSALDYARERRHNSIVGLIEQHLLHLSGESQDDAEASSSVSSPGP